MGDVTLLTGGARSGKSSLAVRMAQASAHPVAFIATAEARDDEMAERILLHRAERPSGWPTIEAPLEILPALAYADADAFVVLDCLALFVSNALEATWSERELVMHVVEFALTLRERDAGGVIVTNEVGLGLVPMNELARSYRDALGRVNAALAEHVGCVLLVVAGRVLELKESAV